MNRKIFYLSLLLLASVVVLAGLLTSPAAADGNPQASGHGNLTTEDGGLRTFSFTAVQHADGSVTGNAQLKSRGPGFLDHYQIDCLNVVGNTAVMSGPVKKTNDPAIEGFIALFAVEDNGEGQGAQPDRISQVFFDTRPNSCHESDNQFSAFEDGGFMLSIEAGNIQVKP